MRLKPRRSPSKRQSVAWGRINSHPSQGWGLAFKTWHPHIPSLSRRNLLVGACLFVMLCWSIGFVDHVYSAPPPTKPGDPDVVTPLWVANDADANGDEFNANAHAGYTSTALWTGGTGEYLAPDGTNYANFLAKNGFDPSSVSGKHFKLLIFWKETALTTWPTNAAIQFYLTRNSTLATQAGYNPRNDPSVALSFTTIFANPGWAHDVLIQRVPTETINNENFGCNQGGSAFICDTTSGTNFSPGTQVVQSAFWLNFTGQSAVVGTNCAAAGSFPQGGSGCSVIIATNNGAIAADTGVGLQNQPPFLFQGQRYYLGAFADGSIHATIELGYNKGTFPNQVDPTGSIAASGSMQLSNAQIISTGVTISPTTDTGSFFGNLIDGFLTLGLFIPAIITGTPLTTMKQAAGNMGATFGAQMFVALSQFMQWLFGNLVSLLNDFGNVFGISNLGTSISTFFSNIATMLSSLATNFGSWLGSLITDATSFLSIFTTMSATLLAAAATLLSGFSTGASWFVSIIGYIFAKGGASLLTLDVIGYFLFTGSAGMDGLSAWLGWNRWGIMSVLNLAGLFINAVIKGVDFVVSHVPFLSASGGQTENHTPPAVPLIQAGDKPPTYIAQTFGEIRKGDPISIFLWIAGAAGMMLFLASSLSPLNGIVAGFGCNPTTCINNGLSQIWVPFSALFVTILLADLVIDFLSSPMGHEAESGHSLPSVPRALLSKKGRVKLSKEQREHFKTAGSRIKTKTISEFQHAKDFRIRHEKL